MSYYLTDGASVPTMVSSNQGWYDFTEWLEEQDPDVLTQDFVETGECDNPEGILNELNALPEPDDDNILTVLDTLKAFLKTEPHRVILSDGMVEDSEDEDDLTDNFNPNQPRDSEGQFSSGGGFGSAAHKGTAEQLGVSPEAYAWVEENLDKSEKQLDKEFPDEEAYNKVPEGGWEYLHALKKMPKEENDPKFKKINDDKDPSELVSQSDHVANVNGHPFLLNKWEDPDDPDNPKAFVWAYQAAGSSGKNKRTEETDTKDNKTLIEYIQANEIGDFDD